MGRILPRAMPDMSGTMHSTSVTRRSRSHLAILAFVLRSGSAGAAVFFFAAGFFAVAFFEAGMGHLVCC